MFEILQQFWSVGGSEKRPVFNREFDANGSPIQATEIVGSEFSVRDGALRVHTEGFELQSASGWAIVQIKDVKFLAEAHSTIDSLGRYSTTLSLEPATAQAIQKRIALCETLLNEPWVEPEEVDKEVAAFEQALKLL